MTTVQASVHFASASDKMTTRVKNEKKTEEMSRTGRELVADSNLGQYIAHLRKAIGRTYLDGSLYVKLYQELSREPGATVLRNWRRITEKVDLEAKTLEGKDILLSELSSYGILGNKFVLYMPTDGQKNNFYVTIAQYDYDITKDQQEFLKRLILRTTRPPPDPSVTDDSGKAV